jgi:hypothetical protein
MIKQMKNAMKPKVRSLIRETVRDVLAEKASEEYCKNTDVEDMGFTQRASCKAQGYIERSDGEKKKSDKYESITEAHDTDGEYAKAKLREVNKFSVMLYRRIRDDQDLPEWIMEKIMHASDDLNESFQYLDNN